MGSDQTQMGTAEVSVLCISRARLHISAGDALAQRDTFRLNTEQEGETGVRLRARLGNHTPVPAETSPAQDLAHFCTYCVSKGGFRTRRLFWLFSILNP